MNKKLCALLLSAAMCFCFTACSNTQSEQSTTQTTTVATTETTATQTTTEVATAEATESTTVAETTTEAKSTTKKAKSKDKTTSTSVASTKKFKATTKKSKTVTTKAKQKTTANSKADNTVTCTVNVECKSILDNMDKLKEGHEEFVPDNGYVIKNYTYKGKKGDTAYDALKKACKDKDVKLTARSTSYGVYISGINNIDEFDCGKQSGWLYSVNNKYPNTTCGNVEVSTGDTITFEYTCSY